MQQSEIQIDFAKFYPYMVSYTTLPKYGLWEYNRCKTQCCKSNGRMLQKIPRINKKSPEFRIDFMAANRYNLGT